LGSTKSPGFRFTKHLHPMRTPLCCLPCLGVMYRNKKFLAAVIIGMARPHLGNNTIPVPLTAAVGNVYQITGLHGPPPHYRNQKIPDDHIPTEPILEGSQQRDLLERAPAGGCQNAMLLLLNHPASFKISNSHQRCLHGELPGIKLQRTSHHI